MCWKFVGNFGAMFDCASDQLTQESLLLYLIQIVKSAKHETDHSESIVLQNLYIDALCASTEAVFPRVQISMCQALEEFVDTNEDFTHLSPKIIDAVLTLHEPNIPIEIQIQASKVLHKLVCQEFEFCFLSQ
jgi:hypothetical protein